jgi:hypothetical protein
MGAWGSGPFENDGAGDFLGEGGAMPAPSIAQVLLRIVDAAPGEYIDVDDGQAAHAACEIVALGYGYGNLEAAPKSARQMARTIGPNDELRLLAIRALARLRDRKTSELAQLWEGDTAFDASLVNLVARLDDAGD